MRYFICVNVLLSAIVGIGLVQQQVFAAKCPCDIYEAGGTPCVAAHSTVRALYNTYGGPLYQVRRTSDNQTKDIGVLDTGGFANAATQDDFLNGQPGTISKIYDQSPNANHLIRTPAGGWLKQPGKEAPATKGKIMVNGHPAYGVYIIGTPFGDNSQGMGYRNNSTKGVATGNEAEGMYMVVSGKYYNGGCCFDYGNAQTNNEAKGPATMESIYFGNSTQWGHGSGSGPWVMNDCEFGIQAGYDPNQKLGVYLGNTPIIANYVTGIVKSTTANFYAIRGGDANAGKLKTMYTGRQAPGYYPKQLEGAIVLGIGGDNSTGGNGTFFEGAMTRGCPSDTTEDSVQANIIAAGYGSSVTPVRYVARGVVSGASFKVGYHSSSGSVIMNFTLQDTRHLVLNVFDQRGRRIAAIVDGVLPEGRHETVWNTRHVPAGVYVYSAAIDGMKVWAGKIVVGK